MDTALQDVRFAARSLLRSPSLAAIATVCFALGIGANTAIFSIVKAVLFQSLPYDRPASLVMLDETYLNRGDRNVASVSPPVYLEWRKHTNLIAGAAAYITTSADLGDVADPERLRAILVTTNVFAVLGARPLIGRTFTEADAPPSGAPVAMISEGFWRRRFGSDRSLLGSTITLGGTKTTVIGVMPAAFDFPIAPYRNDVWVPLDLTKFGGASGWGNRSYRVVARLAPGVDSARAASGLDVVAQRLSREVASQRDRGVRVSTMLGGVVGKFRLALLVLLGTVGVVLLVACSNVANLLLARGERRRREFAVRISLGATRGRLIRQLLTETILLAAAGGCLGMAIAWQATRSLSGLVASVLPRGDAVSIDGRVLLFAMSVSLVTGAVVGLIPALRAARLDLRQDLSQESGRSSAGQERGRALSTLIVAELALSLVLLVGASLMVRSFLALLSIDVGFRAEHVVTFHVAAPPRGVPDSLRFEQFYNPILAGARALPGVTAAGVTSTLPIQDGATDRYFTIVGRQLPPDEHLDAQIRIVSSEYFRAMGIPVLSGREFAETDTRLSPRVIMINRTLASQYFPNENPVGQRIDIGEGAATIVGVAQSVRQIGIEQEARAEFYLPVSQERYHTQAMAVVIETRGDPTAIEQAVRRLVRAVDPERPIYQLGTMTSVVAASLASRRMLLVLLVAFAMLALGLAATGLYGVLSYTVAQRTREIGIRIALGAGAAKIAGMVLMETGRVIGIGLAMGLLAALLGAGVLQSLLYGISPHDPLTFVTTPAILAAVAFVASLVPALRATRVDPIVSMRTD